MQGQTDEVEDYENGEKDRKNHADTYSADLRKLLEYPWGLRIIQHIVDECNVSGQTFASESTHDAAFMEGKRAIGISLLKDVKLCSPEKLCKINFV